MCLRHPALSRSRRMNTFELLKSDLFRQAGNVSIRKFILFFLVNHGYRFLVYFRLVQSGSYILKVFRIPLYLTKKKYGLEISLSAKIGPGLNLQHPFNITLNSKCTLGSNVTIYKNATIGSEMRGKRAGVPVIGNNVYIGLSAVVVGSVTIGDNVLIAPNSFVNFDVPANSIVLPGRAIIIQKENATHGYIKNRYEE